MLEGVEYTFCDDEQACAATAITRQGNLIYCGLTGGPVCLAVFDCSQKKFIKGINIFPWANDTPQIVLRKIHNALGCLDDGRIVIGEGILFTWDGIPFNFNEDPNTAHIESRRKQSGQPPLKMKWMSPNDLPNFDLRWLPGGQILTYDPQTKKIEKIAQLKNSHYVQSMVVDPINHKAYGHTISDCHFFEVDITKKTIEDHGRISTWAFHNMVIKNGIVYGAWIDFDLQNKLRLLRFDPTKGYLERLESVLLNDPGERVQGNRGIDQWLVHSNGDIYVGMAGTGALYQFDDKTLKLQELGRIGKGGRITSLEEDERGRVIFTGGFPKMSVGRYDPQSKKITDFGPITNKYDKIYFHGATYTNKTLYLAETDSGVASLWEVPIPD